MKYKRIVSMALSLALMGMCAAMPAYAEEPLTRRITVSYRIAADPIYGAPTVLNPPSPQYPLNGEEFVLAEELKTDSTLGTDRLSNNIYIGEWIFSGWSIPANVDSREEIAQSPVTDSSISDEKLELLYEPEIKTICSSYENAEFTGSWEFVPKEMLVVPDKLDTGDTLPLAGTYDALAKFWPEREAQLNYIYATGLFPESLIKYMDENIKGIPLQNKEFGSVALSDTERMKFLNAFRDACLALVYESDISVEVKSGIELLRVSTTSGTADPGTAFIVYCAEKAGFMEGISKCMIETADAKQLYDFLKNDACADIISADNLLGLYRSEDENVAGEITIDDSSVAFAASESLFELSNSKSEVLPGDLIVFKNEQDNPVTMGLVDYVEGRNISYVTYVNGMPEESELNEQTILALCNSGTRAEIIGLRSCDPARVTYEYLVNDLGLPRASALGVMGNIYYESRFSTTAVGDGNTSFGLCQWHNDRFLNLVIFCMKNDYNIASLEGQLKFLAQELTGKYVELLNELYRSVETPVWASSVAGSFCKVFEQPAELEKNMLLRGTLASGTLWNSYSELFCSETRLQNIKLAEIMEQKEAAAAAAAAQPVFEQQTDCVFYTVRAGDTLASICSSLGFDYNSYRPEILALNHITNENVITEGQTLIFLRSMTEKTYG